MEVLATSPHVDYRHAQLRDLAASLRWERLRRRPGWAGAVRVALGRRLVLVGIGLLDSGRRTAATTR